MQEENGKNTKNKPKSKNLNQQSTLRTVRMCVCVCAYHCAQLSYTIEQRTVLVIFPLIYRTIIVAQMLSTGGKGFPSN